MVFFNREAQLFIPDGAGEKQALQRTTDLCIAAHPDDIEIMAYGPIAACYRREERWFTGLVVTDGAGSPRSGSYADLSDEEMKSVRMGEQKAAALTGEYSAQLLLGYPSGVVKDAAASAPVEELAVIIEACSPRTVYTHNLADKHDTHVAVALRTIAALRRIPAEKRPEKVFSMEVWRGLDWLCDADKTVFDTSPYPTLAAALLQVFDSQISGGKRYDAAAVGRRQANATFRESHAVDQTESAAFGMDITALVNDADADPREFIAGYIGRFRQEVDKRLEKLCRSSK